MDLAMLAPFAPAYLARDPRAAAFLPHHALDPADRLTVARRRAGRAVPPALVAELTAQNAAYGPSAARGRHLATLAAPGAVVVATGQQMGLFLGPLYTLYKAATAVVMARAIERESGVPTVPLFWLQTEDHDFEEIRTCVVPRPGDEPLTVAVGAGDPAAARASVAHRVLGDDVTAALAALTEALGDAPQAAAVVALLASCYRPGAGVAAAFARLLAALFAEEGLVLLDPRTPAVAALAAPLYRVALDRSAELDAALAGRGAELAAAGFAEQVPVRPGASLLFHPVGGITGPRYRLAPADGGYALLGAGRTVPAAEVDALLVAEPLRFSTSALLRPLVQDALLPTVAYVGGPAELSYHAQLAPLYPLVGLEQPLVAPRARLRLLEVHTRALLGRLGLRAADAEAPREALLRRVAAPPTGPEPAALAARARAGLAAVLDEYAAVDPSLKDPVRKARESCERTFAKLALRYATAVVARDHVAAERVDRLQGVLFPGGVPQERVFSLPAYAARHGAATLVSRVLAAIAPFDPAVVDLEL
jgi:bacillithiol biosynthesis cysteine-adding enzyme BshC